MNIQADDLIAALKTQRNAAMDEGALLKAACDDYERKLKLLEARIAALAPPPKDEAKTD